MLKLPCEYVPIEKDDMTYLDGGNAYDVFLFLVGWWMKDIIVAEGRNLVYSVGSAGSLSPVKDWIVNFFTHRSLGSQLLFVGGCGVMCKMLWDRIKS